MLTCKIAVPNSPHAVIVSKNPEFRALYLARWNDFFRLINAKKYISFHFGCWLLPEKFSFCPKNNDCPSLGGCSPPVSLARTPMEDLFVLALILWRIETLWFNCVSLYSLTYLLTYLLGNYK